MSWRTCLPPLQYGYQAVGGVLRGHQVRVEPQLPPDFLGVYVFLPVPAGGPAA
ncbi:MAG: hypothetical protein K6T29_08925 [Peptococcaceae bacterium]|nr:hypothetical protein [Peptococcaceae bacterium]